MNKRIIRDEFIQSKFNLNSKEISSIEPKNSSLHPTALLWVQNTNPINPICITKFQMDNKKNLTILNEYKCKSGLNNYKKFLYIPPIGLDSNDLLNIYSINSIDYLYEWISENLQTFKYPTINRIINCWIRVNFDTLKNYNNYLEKICLKLLEFNSKKTFQDNEAKIKKEVKDFIDYWINKHSLDEFNLELIEDLKDYLLKKINYITIF